MKNIYFLFALLIAAIIPEQSHAQTYQNSCFQTPANPIAIQNGDKITVCRAGVTYNATWPGVIPLATASTPGLVFPAPGGGLSVDMSGALRQTVTGGSFNSQIGSTTTANPWIFGTPTSGFYTPGPNQIGVELNGAKAMQWETLSSGVDYIDITPGKSGTAPKIKPNGSTANQGLNLTGTGTGSVTINGLVINSSDTVTAGVWNGTAIGLAFGGTGLTATPTNGQLPIGNGSGYLLATLTGSGGITVTNGSGTITINGSASFTLPSTTTANQALFSTITSGTAAWSAYTMPASVTINDLLYADSNNDVAVLPTCTSGLIATNGSNVPHCTSAPSIIGTMTATGFVPTNETQAILATTTADSASAGYVGEYQSASLSCSTPSSLTNNTPKVIVALPLTAGDWQVCGQAAWMGSGITTSTLFTAASATTSGAAPGNTSTSLVSNFATGTTVFTPSQTTSYALPCDRVSLAATTTVYLNEDALFATSTAGGCGFLNARRMR